MKQLTIIILIVIPILGFSQIEKKSYKKIFSKFENYYNSEDYQKIFDLYSKGMKQHLPFERTIDFLTGVNREYGKIISHEFIGYQKENYASYKTKFEFGLSIVNISLIKKNKISGLSIGPFQYEKLPKFERNQTEMALPFKGEWTVVWGGTTKELNNHHLENKAQKGAFDIIITDKNGKPYKNNGEINEDYFAFEKRLIAPCYGEIVLVVDGIKDNKPGETNLMYIPGNTVILKTERGEYLVFSHFKKKSIVVAEGQKIKKGDLLGLCGNSGNSFEPHLHFHIQDVEDSNKATGVKCFFKEILVNGELKKDYSPIKGDKIKRK